MSHPLHHQPRKEEMVTTAAVNWLALLLNSLRVELGSKVQGYHQMGHDLAPLILQVVRILWETAASHRSPYAQQQSQQKGNLSNNTLYSPRAECCQLWKGNNVFPNISSS